MNSTDLEKVQTADGSWTLKNKEKDVFYRSSYGAQQESEHVFLFGSKIHQKPSPWRILELGFGTGRNFLTTALCAQQQDVELHYETVDHAPIPPEFIENSDPFSEMVKEALSKTRSKKDSTELKYNRTTLILHPYNWENCLLKHNYFDAVYHDPFAVAQNPNCWSTSCFSWSFKALTTTGILTTYSAAGKIRRAMAEAGFFVAVAKGAGSKREMTLASAQSEQLSGLKIKYGPNL